MKAIQRNILFVILMLCFGIHAQAKDSLTVKPNPFADSAIIHFELDQSDTISLYLMNRWGNFVVSYFQKTILPKGVYSIDLIGDTLQNGTYFLALEMGSNKPIVKTVTKLTTLRVERKRDDIHEQLLFPNPTSGHLNIPVDGKKTILISDMNGRILRSFETDLNIVSVSDLPDGEYFVRVLEDSQKLIFTQKIIRSE